MEACPVDLKCNASLENSISIMNIAFKVQFQRYEIPDKARTRVTEALVVLNRITRFTWNRGPFVEDFHIHQSPSREYLAPRDSTGREVVRAAGLETFYFNVISYFTLKWDKWNCILCAFSFAPSPSFRLPSGHKFFLPAGYSDSTKLKLYYLLRGRVGVVMSKLSTACAKIRADSKLQEPYQYRIKSALGSTLFHI